MRKNNYRFILCLLIILSALFITAGCVGQTPEDDPVKYVYTNRERISPEYEKDIFTIDGVLDENIYKDLRWWKQVYSEGEFSEDCVVRATCYFGENGLYFMFDVDDDNVNVNPVKASFANSCVSLYLASYGTDALNKNVWEIDILPNSTLNAKRYLNNLGYATILPEGNINKPFCRATTKGGELNTKSCKGYYMETYFTYDYLFGKKIDPEYLNINFALIRSFNNESSGRDLYYNFGEKQIANYSWSNPSTWYRFYKLGFDAIKLTEQYSVGGNIRIDDEFVERYTGTSVKIVPEGGYKIVKAISTDALGVQTDVTGDVSLKNGEYVLRLFNLKDDVTLSAEFVKYDGNKSRISGTVTVDGAKVSENEAKTLKIRYYDGGEVLQCPLNDDGSYSLTVNDGEGKIELFSASGYVIKTIPLNVVGDKTADFALPDGEYGKNRNVSLDDVRITRNGEDVYTDKRLWNTVDKTFAYKFRLKYDGEAFNTDGSLIADPTFGLNDNSFTASSIRGMFTDDKGEDVFAPNFLFQFMHWGNAWRIKLYVDGTSVECTANHLIKNLTSEGAEFILTVSDGKIRLFYRADGATYKALESDLKYSADRYLRLIKFYGEENVNGAVWSLSEQSLDFGFDEEILGKYFTSVASMEQTEFKTSDSHATFEKAYVIKPTKNYIARYNVKSSAVSEDGTVGKNAQCYINTWTNTDGSNVWSTNYGVMFYLDTAGNSRLYGWSNSGWTNRTVKLSEESLKRIATDGLDLFITFDGTELAVYIETAENKLEKAMTADATGKSFIAHKSDVYPDSAPLTFSVDVVTANEGTVSELLGLLFVR